jgi:hypothetical protein
MYPNEGDIIFKTHYTNAPTEQKLLIKRSFNEQLFGAVRSLSGEAVFLVLKDSPGTPAGREIRATLKK